MIQNSLSLRESEERTSQRARGGRQITGGGVVSGDCEITGFEVRIREECQVVTETLCTNVTVARYSKRIDQTCTTRVREGVI